MASITAEADPQSTPRSVRNAVWVVVPAYNEEAVIASVVRGLLVVASNVLVVDDGSKDGTRQAAVTAGATVVRHAINLGQGAALQTGITFALHSGASHVATFDGDGQHDPAAVTALFDAVVDQCRDVALGSRFLKHGAAVPAHRRLLLRAALWFTRLQTGLQLTDTHNGLRMFTRAAAEKLTIRQNGMAHASEVLSEIARLRFDYAEVATDVSYTSYSLKKGQSMFDSAKILVDLMSAAWIRQRS